jgi:hypothetical protein
MKKNSVSLMVLFLLLVFACSHDTLPVYEDVDRLYFKWAGVSSPEDRVNFRDYIEVKLGYDNPVKSDSVVYINVLLMGHVSEQDRPITAGLIKNESTAVEGQDIEFLPSFIQANAKEGKLAIKVKNSGKLAENVLMARIRLTPNDYFHVDYTQAVGYSGKNGVEFDIYFDAKTEVPSLWADPETKRYYDAYFGTYSNVKLQVICDACGLTREFFMHDPATEKAKDVMDSRIPTSGVAMGLISIVNRYLKQYEINHGEPLKDEHGNEIKMGLSMDR